jgi:hypothetical protein
VHSLPVTVAGTALGFHLAGESIDERPQGTPARPG